MIPIIDAALNIGGKIIDKLFPDPIEREKAKLQLLQMQQDGELREMQTQLSAILAEAQSADPWTSRARPAFLYVMYLMILAAFPMGIFHLKDPIGAATLTVGVQSWLAAIPEHLWWLFGTGYLGYVAGRSYDKKTLKGGSKK